MLLRSKKNTLKYWYFEARLLLVWSTTLKYMYMYNNLQSRIIFAFILEDLDVLWNTYCYFKVHRIDFSPRIATWTSRRDKKFEKLCIQYVRVLSRRIFSNIIRPRQWRGEINVLSRHYFTQFSTYWTFLQHVHSWNSNSKKKNTTGSRRSVQNNKKHIRWT